MKRILPLIVAFVLLVMAGVAVAQSSTKTHRITDADGDTFDVALPFTVDTIPADTTTTTTEPPTTTVPPLVMPETKPYGVNGDGRGLDSGEGFAFMATCADTATVTCPRGTDGSTSVGTFEYWGHGMPYLYDDAVVGNHDHAWWVNGDREGYRCAYGFMYDYSPDQGVGHDDAHLIARATIVRPVEAGYGAVNDRYMEEAARYYDGTVNTVPGNEIVDEDCQAVALDPDFDYANYVPHGADEIRVGLFKADGQIGDVRDFTKVVTSIPGHFEYVKTENGRVTIVFVVDGVGVSHVFYYDALNDGRLAVEVNGLTVFSG